MPSDLSSQSDGDDVGIRVRTPEEKRAYLDGYRAGVRTCAEHGEDFAIRTMHVAEATVRQHWIATTPGGSGDVHEVAWSEQEAQEYRNADWTVEGPFSHPGGV